MVFCCFEIIVWCFHLSGVEAYQTTYSFTAFTCLFSHTSQLVNRNHTHTCSISISLILTGLEGSYMFVL